MPLGMEVGLSPGDFVLDGDQPHRQKGSGAPQFSVHVYYGQTAGWIKMPVGTEVGLVQTTLLDGDPALPQKRHIPQFSAHVYCGQTAVCIRIGLPLGTVVGFSLCDIVLDCDPAPLPLKGHSPQFFANVQCGQTAGWTTPLGMKVGLVIGDFVFDGYPAPLEERHSPTQFLAHVYCGQSTRWIKMRLGTEVNLGPDDVGLDGVAAPPLKGAQPPVCGS